MSKLTEQTSVRLTPEMREFLQTEATMHQEDTGMTATEGDIIRACIHYAMTRRQTAGISFPIPMEVDA